MPAAGRALERYSCSQSKSSPQPLDKLLRLTWTSKGPDSAATPDNLRQGAGEWTGLRADPPNYDGNPLQSWVIIESLTARPVKRS
jgi:hypothetical protein